MNVTIINVRHEDSELTDAGSTSKSSLIVRLNCLLKKMPLIYYNWISFKCVGPLDLSVYSKHHHSRVKPLNQFTNVWLKTEPKNDLIRK